jgi:hypothetical protein
MLVRWLLVPAQGKRWGLQVRRARHPKDLRPYANEGLKMGWILLLAVLFVLYTYGDA